MKTYLTRLILRALGDTTGNVKPCLPSRFETGTQEPAAWSGAALEEQIPARRTMVTSTQELPPATPLPPPPQYEPRAQSISYVVHKSIPAPSWPAVPVPASVIVREPTPKPIETKTSTPAQDRVPPQPDRLRETVRHTREIHRSVESHRDIKRETRVETRTVPAAKPSATTDAPLSSSPPPPPRLTPSTLVLAPRLSLPKKESVSLPETGQPSLIRVSIGRVEVRGGVMPPAKERAPRGPLPEGPSLESYLNQRDGRIP